MSNFSIGDVVSIDLNPTKGHESKKTRPCVVITVHPKLELVTIFPITDATNKKGQVFVPVKNIKAAGLTKPSVIDTFQIRSVSKERVIKKMGAISEIELFECRKNIALIFEIDNEHLDAD